MSNEKDDDKSSALFAIALIPVIIPFISGYDTFGLGFWGWIIVSSIISAGTAFFAMRETPILSIICGLIFGFTSHYAFNWYFSGRSSFIQIEALIPMILGAVPPFIVYLIGSFFKRS
jgi:hypothetical protein